MAIVEAIYDDYAKATFANYELRKEDLNQLAGFARTIQERPTNSSTQLALISNVDAEPAVNQGGDTEAVNLPSVHQAKGLEFTLGFRYLADRRDVSEHPLARNPRSDRRGAAVVLCRDYSGAR